MQELLGGPYKWTGAMADLWWCEELREAEINLES